MSESVKVSIIIPLKEDNAYIRETLDHLRGLDYSDFEVLALPDKSVDWGDGVHIIPTGHMGPAAKRDLALGHATGDILAFLDDDTYPAPDWLSSAVSYFENPTVAAVGGPAVTPASDSALQRASGHVYASLLGGGTYAYRYIPQAARDVDDYPTCNLLVRRADFEAVGGFDTRFWPGEDTKLCLDLTHRLGKRIVYAPDAVVYHHRRALFGPHLRQVRSYATHRGYFAKRFPKTSLRFSYFLPTLLVMGMVGGGVLGFLVPAIAPFYVIGIALYLLAAVASAAHISRSLTLTPVVAAGIVATHVVYGTWFPIGMLKPKLREEMEEEQR
jgi:cellulose synthase/poly-beta-1,6-N-acetylglucosamine synthase-like glycosyltransferase